MAEVVPVESVYIGERQRRDIDEKHIKDLSLDIAQNGLIHAPVVTPDGNLIVGFCRLTAIKLLTTPYIYGKDTIQPGFIPVNIVAEPDERKLFRIEFAENMRRKGLSPVDEAKAVAQLHKYFEAENPHTFHSKAATGAVLDEVRGESPRTIQARATEVAEALVIDSFANDPDVKKAGSRAEAFKIAKKKMEQQFIGGLGALVIPKSNDFTLLEGDCGAHFDFLEVGTFHGIVCDPPYGMDADKFGDQTSATGHQYADDKEGALLVAESILEHGHRLCKPDAHLYMFCDIRLWPTLADAAEALGWKPFATPLIWHKPGLGHAPQPGYFGRRYECILFAQKGNRKLSKSASDVFTYPAVKDKIYAAQKPVDLLAEILALSFYPGEHILDPCVGSGSIFRAAKRCNLKATGIELNPIAIGLAKAAIAEVSK